MSYCYIICRALLEISKTRLVHPLLSLLFLCHFWLLLCSISFHTGYSVILYPATSSPLILLSAHAADIFDHTAQLSCLLRCFWFFFSPLSLSNLHHLCREGLNSSTEEKSKPSYDTLFFTWKPQQSSGYIKYHLSVLLLTVSYVYHKSLSQSTFIYRRLQNFYNLLRLK